MNVLVNTSVLILTFGILITFHEFGHFWVARRFGVRVLRFSVGFGKPLWSRIGKDGVEYVIAALPLGGYVKMLDKREGEVAAEEIDREFTSQPLSVRTAIVAAGPLFNFLLAVLLYFSVFIAGVSGVRPIVGEVVPESVSARAGVVPGDEIVAVDGRPVTTWQQALHRLLDSGTSKEQVALGLEGDETGSLRVVTLDLSSVNLLDEQDVLDSLGIVRARPRHKSVIGEVVPGGPAEQGGLKVKDRIVSFDGTPVEYWSELVEEIRIRPGQTVDAVIARDGRLIDMPLTLAESRRQDGSVIGRLGVRLDPDPAVEQRYLVQVRYEPWEALLKALTKTWDMSVLTLRVIWRMLTGEASLKNISGPLTIAEFAGLSMVAGLGVYAGLLALLSISIGILNLLPVPLLDGGHLLYYAIEFVKGSPVSDATQILGQKIGIVLIAGLMLVAFYNDFYRLLS